MDNRKDDRYYAQKIIEDLKIIIENTKGASKEDLKINSILCDSVLFRIIQISERTDKLTESFKANYPTIPWRAIKGMRNRIVHEYPHMYRVMKNIENLPASSGIYMVVNMINHKKYIGQSKNIKKRFQSHHLVDYKNENNCNYNTYEFI